MKSTTVRLANSRALAAELGIDVQYCTVMLAEVSRHAPNAEAAITGTHEPRLAITLPYEHELELVKHPGFVTIGCHDGGFPGELYFRIIPFGSIADQDASLRYQARLGGVEVIEDTNLAWLLGRQMEPVYARIAKIRASRSN